jgi:putative ubiquitin-RnfH superfamily antitoxin RatB of RatAB toxin-antitoxin module
MAPAEGARGLRVEVVYCPRPGVTDRVALTLPAGATAVDALVASGLAQRHGLAGAGLKLGIWSRACEPGSLLRDRDRVEIYRALVVDPKEARRLRYARHKERLART